MIRLRAVVCMATVVGTAVACGPPRTSLTQVWQAEAPRTPLNRILVLSVRMDEANRRVLEDTFVQDLARHGVSAAPAYTVFPGDLPPMDQARAEVSKDGFDGVLVLKLRGVRDEAHYVPSSMGFWGGYYGMWGGPGYYGGSPGYLVTDQTVIFETTLWDLRTGNNRLLWTARTETLNPSNGTDFAISLKRAVDPTLAKNGFIAPAQRR